MVVARLKKKRSCFIAASAGTEIEPFVRLLEERDIMARTALDVLPRSGLSILASLEREIEKADFLCGIVSFEGDLRNVFYELGFAHGIKKPVFLVIEREERVQIDLIDMPYVRASLRDRTAIGFALDQFLSNIKTTIVEKPIVQRKAKHAGYITLARGRPGKGEDRYSLRQFLGFLEKSSAIEIESHFAGLLREMSGVEVVEKDQPMDKGVDMVLWIEALRSTIGNPILVEFKIGELSESTLSHAEQWLRSSVDATHAAAGLLVYFDKTGRRFEPSGVARPLVMRFELRNLIEMLHDHSLARAIVSERNRITHLGK